MKIGDAVIVFDSDEWRKIGDIGDNSQFYKESVIVDERFSFNRPIVDVRFKDGRISYGHFKEFIKPTETIQSIVLYTIPNTKTNQK